MPIAWFVRPRWALKVPKSDNMFYGATSPSWPLASTLSLNNRPPPSPPPPPRAPSPAAGCLRLVLCACSARPIDGPHLSLLAPPRDPDPGTPAPNWPGPRTPDHEAFLGVWGAHDVGSRLCLRGVGFVLESTLENVSLKTLQKQISEGSRLKFRCKSKEAADVLSSPLVHAMHPIRKSASTNRHGSRPRTWMVRP